MPFGPPPSNVIFFEGNRQSGEPLREGAGCDLPVTGSAVVWLMPRAAHQLWLK